MKNGFFLLPALRVGGAEIVAVRLAAELKDKFDLTIVTFENSTELESPVPHFSFGRDIYSEGLGGLTRLKQWWAATADLARYKRRVRPDFVLSFMELCNIANALTKHGESTMLSVHTQTSRNVDTRIGPLLSPLIRTTYSMANHVACVSQGAREDLESMFGVPNVRSSVIPNPVDAEEIGRLSEQSLPRDLEFLEGADYIVSVGRLVTPKNHAFMLQVFARVREANPNLRLVLVGSGQLEETLIMQARELGLTVWTPTHQEEKAAVIFCGLRPNPFPIVRRAQVFVFTSIWEGFGLALVESLACGVPVCTNDCKSGPREVMGYGDSVLKVPARMPHGSLIPVDDMEAWVGEIIHWLTAEQNPKQIRKAAERFGVERIGEQWRNLINSEG